MKHAHSRRSDLPFPWPDPPLHVVLVHPQIPPNTGNVARLCAATGSKLHLVKPMGFTITDAKLKRAGLDYWDSIEPIVHESVAKFMETESRVRLHLFSTGASTSFFDAAFRPGDYLLFGSETEGLPDDILKSFPSNVIGIPLKADHVRSLNLSTAVGIAVYEALRQIKF